MTATLEVYLRQALTRLTRLVGTAKAGGARECDREIKNVRLLEELIKEQMPYEDAGSSTRAPR
ncbi:MAG: hypothetical protein NDI61_08235 [Bdellovibrionaceae bacterium]|nr:hypothetical protein [Pseudobdellovibrionaceae bacterium]